MKDAPLRIKPYETAKYETDSKVLYDIREILANNNKVLREILAVLQREVIEEYEPGPEEEQW